MALASKVGSLEHAIQQTRGTNKTPREQAHPHTIPAGAGPRGQKRFTSSRNPKGTKIADPPETLASQKVQSNSYISTFHDMKTGRVKSCCMSAWWLATVIRF